MEKYTSTTVRQLNRKGKPWQARVKYKDEFGNWKEYTKMLPDATGKKDAQKKAEKWKDELNAEAEQMPTAGKATTVDKIYMKYLKYQLDIGEIEKSTYSNSIHTYNRYIKPYLGNYTFATVDKNILGVWLTKLYGLGLSQNTIHTIYARLKKVYNYYYNSGELQKDPFKGVKMPKKGEPKITHLTNEQMDQVLSALNSEYEEQDPMYVGILLAYYAGLRRGEICGLRWNDIDFESNTITIRSAVGVSTVSGEGGGDYTKAPKNKSSNRTFPMVSQLRRALEKRKEILAPKGQWFVIGEEEQFMRPQQYNRYFAEFVKKNNLVDAYGKKIVPHGLRHNLATVGIHSGMDIASLSRMMGHASRAMTLDTYGDASADALVVASVKLSDTFKQKSEIDRNISDALDEIEEKTAPPKDEEE